MKILISLSTPKIRIAPLAILILLGVSTAALAEDRVRIRRIESPSANGFVSAIRVANAPLVHTTQLFPPNLNGSDSRAQSEAVLKELDRVLAEYQSQRADVVKLNVYVRNAVVREEFLELLAKWSGGKLPAVASVATRLPEPNALIAVDAVFVSRRQKAETSPSRDLIQKQGNSQRRATASVLPLGDVIYVSGQAQPGELAAATRSTLDELQRTLKHLQLDQQNIVQVKCFLQPMGEAAAVNREIAEFFGDNVVPPVSHVEWTSNSPPIEIELVAWASPGKSTETVSYVTPPWMKSSPVFSRVARIHGNDRIYVSGLYSSKAGDGEQQVRWVFEELQRILKDAGSDMRHLAKATYYVSQEDASQELNRLRPEYYDPSRPPAASKAPVSDVGMNERGITLDMICAPASPREKQN